MDGKGRRPSYPISREKQEEQVMDEWAPEKRGRNKG